MKPTVDTIIRTILLAVTIVNQVLTSLGKNPIPFSDEEIYGALTTVATVVMTLWAWWKNNSFTNASIRADEYMNALKSQAKKEKVDYNNKSNNDKEDELK